MITSIGLNPCIDTVLNVKSIKSGHYDVKPKFFPGGSAINVVLVIDKLRKIGKIGGFAQKTVGTKNGRTAAFKFWRFRVTEPIKPVIRKLQAVAQASGPSA